MQAQQAHQALALLFLFPNFSPTGFYTHGKSPWGSEPSVGGGETVPTYIYNITYIIYRRDLGGGALTNPSTPFIFFFYF